jgi:SAM-dependent methyltransferase
MAIDLAALDPAELEIQPVRRTTWARAVLFGTTAFVGAGLLFVVQPLIAKLILPSYGGSATVWSTSSLFFQVLLLMAYAYAHWSTSRLGPAWQPKAHLVVLLLPLVALPLAIPSDAAPSADASPVLWLLRTLVLVIGLPFAVVATTGPLLQRWYSWGDHRRSEDPYFLFAASNLGSFGGLLAYPLLIEPHLTLASQRSWWSGGFFVFVALTATCALSVRRSSRPAREQVGAGLTARPGRAQVLRWTALAFLPSSLMLGVTSHISTDVAAIPLLWVVPLAIYLATFVLAFARTSRVPPKRVTQVAVATAFAVAVTSLQAGSLGISLAIGLNLVMLALVAYAAHARLAAERPSTEHLTGYYMVVATGGALGGLLNGLVAPVVFDRVLEYSLALMLVPLLLLGLRGGPGSERTRPVVTKRVRAAGVSIGYLLVPLVLALTLWSDAPWVRTALLTCLAIAVGWGLAHLPKVMILALVLFFIVGQIGGNGEVLERSRTFFGSYTVYEQDGMHRLIHGTTLHGTQFLDASRRRTPTTYYSASGPLGDVFTPEQQNVAVVGLGTGTVAAYGRQGQTMTFFEIDPEIVRMARDPRLFSYLADSAATIETVVADGRLGIAKAEPGSFDMVVLDAFSSDSIPVHLLTEEAISSYVDRLAPGGLLLVHISNRVFDLEPVLAGAAERLGLAAVTRFGGDDGVDGATPSEWVALGRDASDVARLAALPGWRELGPRQVRWTDDYSSILTVLDQPGF